MKIDKSQVSEEQAYRMVEGTVWKLARSYAAGSGLEAEDLAGEAALEFVKAYRTYDPDKPGGCNFNGWVYLLVSRRLFDVVCRHKRTPRLAGLPSGLRCRRRRGVLAWASELSEDAALLVRCVALPPADVVIEAFTDTARGTELTHTLKRCVRGYLENEWGGERAQAAYAEVGAALAEGI